MTSQYIRYVSLVISNQSGAGIELGDLAIKFAVHHSSFSFPHTADIRIYNLSKQTQNMIGTEFTEVSLVAGYVGNFGLIFRGTIRQVRKGREVGTDSYTDIFAADGDEWHNQAVIKTTIPSGYTQDHVWQAITQATQPYNQTAPLTTPPANQNPSPRGKVMYGPVRETVRDWSNTNQQLVTTDHGVIRALPLLAYKQGDAIVINSTTGMIGVPEQTEEGITITCLLNPAIEWSSRIQINNADITSNLYSSKTQYGQQVVVGEYPRPPIFPDLAADGFYKALAVDHVGTTRDNPFYTQIIAIALDPTTFPGVGQTVKTLDTP
jgi:hypothetical protein